MMKNIGPPKYVRNVLFAIQSRGHMVCLVGGCVRDMILGVQPNDWDVCTSALPEQVLEIFPDSVTNGMKHGTVGVKQGSRIVEVTTFRSEGEYTDHRHPGAISFVGSLTTDLSRRDFTMNAIAIPPDGIVTDPFGGVDDIKNKLVRCVGDPEQRFEEDALRMFRALRFAARLNFEIESATLAGIEKKAHLAANISPERIAQELEKLLLTKRPADIFKVLNMGLLDNYLVKRPENEAAFKALARLPQKAADRWCGLCLLLRHQGCIDWSEGFLRALHLDSRTISFSAETAKILDAALPEDAIAWKKLLCRWGVDAVSRAVSCYDAFSGQSRSKDLKAVLKSGECFSMQNLAVSGEDLMAQGLKGKDIGDMLSFLLDYVIEHPQNNRRELLLSFASSTED